jgi:hypothetical protein
MELSIPLLEHRGMTLRDICDSDMAIPASKVEYVYHVIEYCIDKMVKKRSKQFCQPWERVIREYQKYSHPNTSISWSCRDLSSRKIFEDLRNEYYHPEHNGILVTLLPLSNLYIDFTETIDEEEKHITFYWNKYMASRVLEVLIIILAYSWVIEFLLLTLNAINPYSITYHQEALFWGFGITLWVNIVLVTVWLLITQGVLSIHSPFDHRN